MSDILNLAIGRKMKVMTDVGVEVELEIKEIKPEHHSRDLEPATQANDWWPATENWTTYCVTFTNGHKKNLAL